MNDVHKRVMNEILRTNKSQSSDGNNALVEKDKMVRKEIAELYHHLSRYGDPKVAINLLSDHVAIMVDMINEFKSKAGK